MRASILGLVVALSALSSGCSCGPDQTEQAPSSPVGSIAGRVTSLRDGAALEGAKVTVIQVGKDGAMETSINTSVDGTFAIQNLPAGASYRVRFALGSYVSRFLDVTVPDAAGDFPQGNGVAEANIALAPASAGITGKIIASGARAAAGAKVGIDLRPANYDLVAEAVADASGVYTFAGLPGGPTGVPVTIVVQPYDEDNDGQADYGVLSVNSLAFPGITTRTEIDLRQAANALTLLASNMDDGQLKATDPMSLVFNRPLDPTRLEVTLDDTDRDRNIATAYSLDATSSILTITASGGSLAEAVDYRLTVSARATNGSTGTFNRYFQAVTATTAPLPAVTGLEVTPVDVDWNDVNFGLRWNIVPGATAYRIYAKDKTNTPSYMLLTSVGASPTPTTNISLPSFFDSFSGDGVQTPFAFKNEVDFAVVAVNALGDSADPATATAVNRKDTTAPRITSATQNGNADNTAGSTAREIELNVRYSEYMDTSVAPVLELPVGLNSTYEPDANLRNGVFTITVPAGVNGTGNYQIKTITDSSGLALEVFDGALTSSVQLLANGNFDSCTLNNWSQTNTSSSSAPTTVNSPVAAGACAARVGNGAGSTQSGTSAIWQQVTIPSSSTVTFTAQYRSFSNYAASGHDSVSCQLQNSGGGFLQTLFSSYSNDGSYNSVTVDLTAYSGQTVRIYCNSYQDGSHISGMYLDEITLTSNP